MVRGYTIGWGIGVPDVYTKVLDGKQRYYQIENLRKRFNGATIALILVDSVFNTFLLLK